MLSNRRLLVYDSGCINHYERKQVRAAETKDKYRNGEVIKRK
jgi:hypothetical protein